MKTVGILGGGQLGLMLANSLYTLGAEVVVYDPDPLAPLCRHAGNVVNGSWNDYKKIEEFVKRCDIITYEFENVECDPLRPISAIAPIYPSLDVLAITQNRINEKQFLSASNLPHVKFAVASSLVELRKEGMSFRFPFVIKTARGGYDGKGQFSINNEEDLENALTELSIGKGENNFLAVLEEFIEIESEVSCIVARDLKGSISTFPVFENFHKNHILDKTYLPCSLPENIQAKVIEIANQATVALDVNGLLTTEFFVSRTRENETTGAVCGDYPIHINEFAPRPHNSGHITRNACHSSQFDALAKFGQEELEQFIRHCSIMEIEEGGIVMKKDSPGDGLYMILAGETRVRIVAGGQDTTLADVSAGSFIGEVAMFSQTPRSADVIALSRCSLLFMSHEQFRNMIYTEPLLASEFLFALGRVMAERMVTGNQRLQSKASSEFLWL